MYLVLAEQWAGGKYCEGFYAETFRKFEEHAGRRTRPSVGKQQACGDLFGIFALRIWFLGRPIQQFSNHTDYL